MHDKIFDIYRQRIGRLLEHEGIKAYRESVPLTAEYAWSKEPVSFANRLSLKYAPVREGIAWGNEWESAWFHLTCKVPKGFAGKELCLRIHTGGEAMVFDGEGTPIYSLTEVSAFNAMYYKDRFVIGSDFKAGDKIEYWVEAAANGLFGVAQPSAYDENPAKPYGSYTAVVRALRLCVFDRQLWAFMLDMKCLNDLMNTYPKDNYRARQLLHILNKALDIYAYTPENAPAARAYLAEKAFSQHAADSALTACAIGHAHIDVGWLWPVRESIRKADRKSVV